jgi:pimeloyl-ACP methyl ester carboxylesterase
MLRTRIRRAMFLLGALLAGGCHYLRDADVPMPSVRHGNLGPERARGVIVLLPGIGDEPEDFVKKGLVEDLVARRDFDVVAADAHFAYYRKRVIVERLFEDVIRPLRRDGYKEVWLVGISLGGLGSVHSLRVHGAEITGAILLAPFLGDPALAEEVERAGGIPKWVPGNVDAMTDEEQRTYRRAWQWFRLYHDAERKGPQLFLGYGESDRFAPINALVAEILPADHVATVKGGHDWKTWRALLKVLSERAWSKRPAAVGESAGAL